MAWEEHLATCERLRSSIRPRGQGGACESGALLQGLLRCRRSESAIAAMLEAVTLADVAATTGAIAEDHDAGLTGASCLVTEDHDIARVPVGTMPVRTV
jgi:hypothetical protein